MPERWLPVPVVDYEELYEISDKGRTRRISTGRILRGRPHPRTGHLTVSLSRNGIEKSYYIHHLVLEAFVEPRPEGMIGCHRNDISDDNRLENLKWDTYSGNNFDIVRNGKHRNARKQCCPKCGGPYDLVCNRGRGRRCSRCTRLSRSRRA